MTTSRADLLAGAGMTGGEGFCDSIYNVLKNHFYGAAAPASPENGTMYLADDGFTYIYFDTVWYKLVGATGAAWTKTIGATGDYATWAAMIAEMPDTIAHVVTATIQKGTTLTELCDIKNKHAILSAGTIIIRSDKFLPDPAGGAISTADSATATTLRDVSVFDTNDEYNDCWVLIVDGTGTDNGFIQITDTLAASGDIVVAGWPGVQPDGTSKYIIVGALIDGGGAREAGMEIYNNTCNVRVDGVGIINTTENGLRCSYNNNHFLFRSGGFYDIPFSGLTAAASVRVDVHGCGIVKCNTNNHAAHAGMKIGSCKIAEVSNCGISDNLQRGIYGTEGSFVLVTGNSGDLNGAWGSYAVDAAQMKFAGAECSGGGGNHSDPGTAGAAASDQASGY